MIYSVNSQKIGICMIYISFNGDTVTIRTALMEKG